MKTRDIGKIGYFTSFWNIQEIDSFVRLDDSIEPFKGPREFSCRQELDKYDHCILAANISFSKENQALEIRLRCRVKDTFNAMDSQVVCAKCWIQLLNLEISKQVQKSKVSAVKKTDFDDEKKSNINIFESVHIFNFLKNDFENPDSEFHLLNINFEVDFLVRHTRLPRTEKITNRYVLLEKLGFLDAQIKKLSDQSEKVNVKLSTSNDKAFIEMPVNIISLYSPIMKSMINGNSNAQEISEARNLNISVDPKFSIEHLNSFRDLILGPESERFKLLSMIDIDHVKAVYEFLDMYQFNAWKPVILQKAFELIPSSHDLIEWVNKFDRFT
jgi:hypothetical protein